MTIFEDATVVYAGGSSSSSAREYIVFAGSSNQAERVYVVKYLKNFIAAKNSTILVASSTVEAWNIVESSTSVDSFPAEFLFSLRVFELDNSSITVNGSFSSLLEIDLRRGSISVASSTVEFFNQTTTQITVQGSTSQVYKINLGSGTVYVTSPLPELQSPVTSYINVLSGLGDHRFLVKIISIDTIKIQIDGSINSWSLSSNAVQCKSGTTDLRYLARVANLQPYALGVGSATANLIFINLGYNLIGISDSLTKLGLGRFLNLETGSILVKSQEAVLRDESISFQVYPLGVSSGSCNMRLLKSGYFPAVAPTTRSFTPPLYGISKTNTMIGSVSRRLMCSAPSEGILELGYSNISYEEANNIISAFEDSVGSYYGFMLPLTIAEGAGDDLLDYFMLKDSSLKWFFNEKPVIESVQNNICNLSVSLKARIKT